MQNHAYMPAALHPMDFDETRENVFIFIRNKHGMIKFVNALNDDKLTGEDFHIWIGTAVPKRTWAFQLRRAKVIGGVVQGKTEDAFTAKMKEAIRTDKARFLCRAGITNDEMREVCAGFIKNMPNRKNLAIALDKAFRRSDWIVFGKPALVDGLSGEAVMLSV